MPLTPEELRMLCDAATPGPWSRHDTSTMSGIMCGEPPKDRAYLKLGDGKRICYCNPDVPNVDNNLAFIAAARTAMPELLEKLEALEAVKNLLNDVGEHGWLVLKNAAGRVADLEAENARLKASLEARY